MKNLNLVDVKSEDVVISPSLICADLCNLLDDIKQIEKLGIHSLHVDLLDGHFSPSMPLGLATVEQLRKKSNMDFDVHLMTTDNEFFIQELIKIDVQSITFHYESAFHVERMIQLIKASGIKVGIALNPATSLHVLDYVIDSCDYILLMLISPGYAGHKNETMVPYALKKIQDCKELIKQKGLSTKIIVDGRVSMETISNIVAAGADYLVAGSTSLFKKGHTISENYVTMNEKIEKGLAARLNSTRSA